MAVNPPVDPIPEPQQLIEAGVTTSEWLALKIYAGQAAGALTMMLVGKLGFHWTSDLLASVVGLELGLGYATGRYFMSRGIRKAGLKG